MLCIDIFPQRRTSMATLQEWEHGGFEVQMDFGEKDKNTAFSFMWGSSDGNKEYIIVLSGSRILWRSWL